MPKTVIDYSNTIFYKISCKDDSISDLYIGHTTNFVQRKNGHKQSCNNSKSANHACKLYEFIRHNGGWDNWRMDIIAHHECQDHSHARTKEQEYFIYYHATLNSIEPMPRPISSHEDDICGQVCDLLENGQTNKNPTATHANNVIRRTPTEYVCHCGNSYKHRQSLHTHKKRCSVDINKQCVPSVNAPLVFEIFKQNKEFNTLMMEQSKQLAEQHSKLLEAIHDITSNIR